VLGKPEEPAAPGAGGDHGTSQAAPPPAKSEDKLKEKLKKLF
jgi:hypothetical protein